MRYASSILPPPPAATVMVVAASAARLADRRCRPRGRSPIVCAGGRRNGRLLQTVAVHLATAVQTRTVESRARRAVPHKVLHHGEQRVRLEAIVAGVTVVRLQRTEPLTEVDVRRIDGGLARRRQLLDVDVRVDAADGAGVGWTGRVGLNGSGSGGGGVGGCAVLVRWGCR